jgi:hypothetical protein
VGQVENPRRSEKAKGLTTHNDRNQRQKSGDKKVETRKPQKNSEDSENR